MGSEICDKGGVMPQMLRLSAVPQSLQITVIIRVIKIIIWSTWKMVTWIFMDSKLLYITYFINYCLLRTQSQKKWHLNFQQVEVTVCFRKYSLISNNVVLFFIVLKYFKNPDNGQHMNPTWGSLEQTYKKVSLTGGADTLPEPMYYRLSPLEMCGGALSVFREAHVLSL